MSRVLPYLPGKRLVMGRLGERGWGQLRLSTLRLQGRSLEDTLLNPRTALNGPTVGSHFLRVEAIIGLPSICRPRGVGPGGRRGAKERITI